MSLVYRVGECSTCGKHREIVKRKPSGNYCHYCNQKRLDEKKGPKEIKPIAKESIKRGKENRIYLAERKKHLTENPECEAKVIDEKGKFICTYIATDCHHMAGKTGKLYTDKTNFLAVCRECHRWIELNPIEAKKRGFSRSRLETNQEIIPEGEWAEWPDELKE
jgi:hypothetical protein